MEAVLLEHVAVVRGRGSDVRSLLDLIWIGYKEIPLRDSRGGRRSAWMRSSNDGSLGCKVPGSSPRHGRLTLMTLLLLLTLLVKKKLTDGLADQLAEVTDRNNCPYREAWRDATGFRVLN